MVYKFSERSSGDSLGNPIEVHQIKTDSIGETLDAKHLMKSQNLQTM